jgi:LysR family glycine cleavage system transcriptional activator
MPSTAHVVATTGKPAGIYNPSASVGPLTFQGVDVSGATGARLAMNAYFNAMTHTATTSWGIRYRFNGGAWRDRLLTAAEVTVIRAVDADQARLSLTALPTFGTSWLTPKLGHFRAAHPRVQVDLELSGEAQDLTTGRFDAGVRNGHGRWPGLRTLKLLPSICMPLCSPKLRKAAAALTDARRAHEVPLIGRADWWALWFRALDGKDVSLKGRIHSHLSTEYLDAKEAIAGHGITIGSPILFRDDIDAGRLVPAHDLVVGDGRTFWFAYPVARQDSRKVAAFRDWIADEAEREMSRARVYSRGARIADAAELTAAHRQLLAEGLIAG